MGFEGLNYTSTNPATSATDPSFSSTSLFLSTSSATTTTSPFASPAISAVYSGTTHTHDDPRTTTQIVLPNSSTKAVTQDSSSASTVAFTSSSATPAGSDNPPGLTHEPAFHIWLFNVVTFAASVPLVLIAFYLVPHLLRKRREKSSQRQAT